MVKRKYMLLTRGSLAELEKAVRAMQESHIPWDLDRNAESITLVQALDDLADPKKRIIAVAMVRELTAEEYAMIQEEQPAGVQGDGTG